MPSGYANGQEERAASKRQVCVRTIALFVSNHPFCHSSVWPMFFDKSLWTRVNQICIVMSAMAELCVSRAHTNDKAPPHD